MAIIVSSLLMLLVFLAIVLVERKCSARSKEFLRKSDVMIADLASSVEEKYREKFGKDPTGQFAVMRDKKHGAKPA